MSKDLFSEYALLDAQFRELEARRETMRVTLLQELQAIEAKTVENEYGKFTVKKNPKVWRYPKKVEDLKEKLRLAQVEAQEKGTATFTQGESLQYTPSKI